MSEGWRPLQAPTRPVVDGEPARSERGTFSVSPFVRLARVHAFSAAGDAMVTVALAGSLFFSIDPSAARWRVGLYLALTIAPFALVSPLIGPAIDRARGGRRLMVIVINAARALVAALMIGSLDSLLLFPLAFSFLVLQKGYIIAQRRDRADDGAKSRRTRRQEQSSGPAQRGGRLRGCRPCGVGTGRGGTAMVGVPRRRGVRGGHGVVHSSATRGGGGRTRRRGRARRTAVGRHRVGGVGDGDAARDHRVLHVPGRVRIPRRHRRHRPGRRRPRHWESGSTSRCWVSTSAPAGPRRCVSPQSLRSASEAG